MKSAKKEKEELEEKYDVESVTVDAMDWLIKDLNENYVKSIAKADRNIKNIRWNQNVKMN